LTENPGRSHVRKNMLHRLKAMIAVRLLDRASRAKDLALCALRLLKLNIMAGEGALGSTVRDV